MSGDIQLDSLFPKCKYVSMKSTRNGVLERKRMCYSVKLRRLLYIFSITLQNLIEFGSSFGGDAMVTRDCSVMVADRDCFGRCRRLESPTTFTVVVFRHFKHIYEFFIDDGVSILRVLPRFIVCSFRGT